MQNNSSIRRSYRLFSIAGFALFALIVTALGFAFLPNIAEAVPDMYVANYNNDTISRANLDGTGGVSLGNLGGTLNGPTGIALDLSNGYMYVANYDDNTISRANLDGTGGVSLGNLGGTLNGPQGIALDVWSGYMYVANGTGNTISRANLDGTGGVSLGNLGGTLNEPHGIALDLRQTGLAVPTLSEWGMIALSLLMAGSAVLIMRRRKLVTT